MSSNIVIGNRGADFVSLNVVGRGEGWSSAVIEVRCDGWMGTFNGSFMKGELSRFAEQLRVLRRDLSGSAQLQPLEPYISLTLTGDGKGHVTVEGTARNHFESGTKLSFEFTIDQTYLAAIVDSLTKADPI